MNQKTCHLLPPEMSAASFAATAGAAVNSIDAVGAFGLTVGKIGGPSPGLLSVTSNGNGAAKFQIECEDENDTSYALFGAAQTGDALGAGNLQLFSYVPDAANDVAQVFHVELQVGSGAPVFSVDAACQFPGGWIPAGHCTFVADDDNAVAFTHAAIVPSSLIILQVRMPSGTVSGAACIVSVGTGTATGCV
jgi:hypothetical protein